MSLEIPMDKLEAVNAMLRDVGDRPVSTLSGSVRFDVSQAEETLDQVSRAVQLRGWFFNTERIRLTVDASNQYLIPDNVIHVEVESGGPTTGQYSETPMLVMRAGKLYDTANQTDVFVGGGEVTLIVQRLLPYESLPSSAREYIYTSASVRNQERALGSRNVDAGLREQARVAYALLLEEEVDSENINLTTSPRFIRMMWDA